MLRLAALALLSVNAIAQFPCQGNGTGSAYLQSTVAVIGGGLGFVLGSNAAPNGIAALCSSDSAGLVPVPGVGNVCLNVLSSNFFFVLLPLDAQGSVALSLPVPNQPTLISNPPLFALAIVFEPAGLSLSKTTRIEWENANAFRPTGSMATPRAQHTATALGSSPLTGETRVFLAGGGGGTVLQPLATNTTEIYDPLTRTFTPGPTMAVPRTLHQAVRLADGRVLLIGGADSGGVVTTGCEIFDPATGTMAPTGNLGSPRAGHQATLLGNGKVLVSGGLATYVDPVNNFVAVMNTAQNTAELYDPTTGVWTAVPGTMAQKRSGHTHTLLPNARVLIAGGIRGGTTSVLLGTPVPVYTNSCTIYDPVANTLSNTGSMIFERAFHGASLLANGDVLVTGGSQSNTFIGSVTASDRCERFNGSTWNQVGALPLGLTNHVQVRSANGNARVLGGLTGAFPNLTASAQNGHHDGVTFVPDTAIGQNPGLPLAGPAPRGACSATLLADGSWLLAGGTDGLTALTSCFVFLE